MRSPTLASAAVTPAPTATTTPQGSCPAMTGSALAGMPVPARGRFFGRRYWCRSDPHMPEAFISSTTSPGPGVGSGKVMISTTRSPGNTTPRMASSVCCLLRRNLSRFVASPYPEIAESCSSETRDREVEIGRLAVGQMPGRGQARESQGPFEQPASLERGGDGQYLDLTVEPPRCERGRGVGIAQDVDEIEGAFAPKGLGVDRQPAARAGIEDVAVMDVAVQHHRLARVGQQLARRRIGFGQESALAARRRRKGFKPA